ncbi:phosphopantetheine-binding protein [Streptomyces sp. NPDC001410]|uniref:phosphopantetheine-binding protein n=1 Tax=Streptomyces sp. NPDC001410 TaxID=3364574 RepID=UPI0036A88D8B
MRSVDSGFGYVRDLPRSEPAAEMETIVLRKSKAVLRTDDSEDLAFDVSYLDLGLTSLELTETRQLLEQLFSLSVDVVDVRHVHRLPLLRDQAAAGAGS